MTLTDFLLARIAEDEAAAGEMANNWPYDGGWSPEHVTRVLAEREAKRRIIDARGGAYPVDEWMSTLTLDWVLSALALPYADHPDYQEEWRP